MDEAQRIATAYHESGHAIMGCVLGRYPQSVDIVRDTQGNAGHTRFNADYPPCMKQWFNQSDEKRRYLRIRVLIGLAGTVAHDLKRPGRPPDLGDHSDYEWANRIVAESMSWDREHHAYVAKCKRESREILIANWASVEAIAEALLLKNSLSRDEIGDIFKSLST